MNKAVIITSYTLARFIQDSLFLARKASFLVQDVQDFMQDLASTKSTCKIYNFLARQFLLRSLAPKIATNALL